MFHCFLGLHLLLFIYHEITNFLTAEKGLTLTGEGTIDNTSEDNSDLGNGDH